MAARVLSVVGGCETTNDGAAQQEVIAHIFTSLFRQISCEMSCAVKDMWPNAAGVMDWTSCFVDLS